MPSRSLSCMLAFALTALSCGSGSHQIRSITINPSSAQSGQNGSVQFAATGHYNSSPQAVTLLQANWAAALEQNVNGKLVIGQPTNAVSVNANGVAQCSAGASGTFAIGAWGLKDPNSNVICNTRGSFGEPGCNSIVGTAQLTCP